MKKSALIALALLVFLAIMQGCKKSNATDTEVGLSVETTPANKSTNLNILGPDFPLKVEITSAMPAKGVKIEVSAAQEGASNVFYTASNNSTAPQNNYSITNTPSGVTCVVNITVTSLSKSTNVWAGTYRYSKK